MNEVRLAKTIYYKEVSQMEMQNNKGQQMNNQAQSNQQMNSQAQSNQQMNNQAQNNQQMNSQNANEAALGLDIDEQEMNGMYGMVETETEDQMEPYTERDGH